MTRKILTLLVAMGLAVMPVHAQVVTIGGGTTVNVPPPLGPVDTLLLGNAGGSGTLNFRAGTLSLAHAGGYSGFLSVGNIGTGTINHDNSLGNSVINITGPQ